MPHPYPPRLAAALTRLAATGIRPSNYAPPLYRLLWGLGLIIPPPHFAGFGVNFLFSALLFGPFWGIAMWFLVWSPQGWSAVQALATATLAGVLFGLAMAAYTRHVARKHKLPPWTEL